MATDKSLNLRQLKTTEEISAAIARIDATMAAMQAALEEIRVSLGLLAKPAPVAQTKLQEASRSVVGRKS